MNLIDKKELDCPNTFTHFYGCLDENRWMSFLFFDENTKFAVLYNIQLFLIEYLDNIPSSFSECRYSLKNDKHIVVEDFRKGDDRCFIKFTNGELLYTSYIGSEENFSETFYIVKADDNQYKHWLDGYIESQRPQLNRVSNWEEYLHLWDSLD